MSSYRLQTHHETIPEVPVPDELSTPQALVDAYLGSYYFAICLLLHFR
jgi:hypothetical protein